MLIVSPAIKSVKLRFEVIVFIEMGKVGAVIWLSRTCFTDIPWLLRCPA
jgi:hypothetical protein